MMEDHPLRELLERLEREAMEELKRAEALSPLEELRVKVLGKKGSLTQVLRGMGQLPAEERPTMGQRVNEFRATFEEELLRRRQALSAAAEEARLRAESVDVTIPVASPAMGHRHPMQQALEDLTNIFVSMGYTVVEGPEIELDYYNFQALNTPADHPARDTQDTFYLTESILLRTQTSSVQARVMEQQKPPIRIISPGAVYRSDYDATHSPVFHQLEGLVIDQGITMADLKGTLDAFAKRIYGPKARTRFRPHHFPFTEPSAEVDFSCPFCEGKGCRLCKGSGWIELLGAGMVHPNVLRMGGIDPEVYSGFAFGMGLERIGMMRYDIPDIRLLFENDVRFLAQF